MNPTRSGGEGMSSWDSTAGGWQAPLYLVFPALQEVDAAQQHLHQGSVSFCMVESCEVDGKPANTGIADGGELPHHNHPRARLCTGLKWFMARSKRGGQRPQHHQVAHRLTEARRLIHPVRLGACLRVQPSDTRSV